MNTLKISLSTNDKISLVSNLSTMLTAGIPIIEAVSSLSEDSKGNTKKVLDVLGEDLMQGKQVNQAFSKFPKIFDKVTVNLIKASEEAGTLDQVLKDLVVNIRKEVEFIDKVKSALIYPMFIVIVFFAVLLMILIVVVPKISSVFLKLNVDLPLPTRIMMSSSDILIHQTVPFIAVLSLLITGFIFLYKKQKTGIIRLFTSLPGLSSLVKKIDLTRFGRSMYLLLNAGVPIGTALELTEEMMVRREISRAIIYSKEVVVSGRALSTAFKDQRNIFPAIMIKITEAGEKTGQLDKAMLDSSEYMDYQVAKQLKVITSLIEPVMLVIVGGLVGGMMLSIIAPIYSIIGQIGGN